MDYCQLLWDLTDAAQNCNLLAHGFIRRYSNLHFSTNEWGAEQQAGVRLSKARRSVEIIEEAMRKWDDAWDALIFVGWAVGMAREPFIIDGKSHQTAHEAARYFAEAVIERSHAEGYSDVERCRDLADKLLELVGVPDFYGHLQGEHHAAIELLPFDEDDENAADGERTADSPPDKTEKTSATVPADNQVLKLGQLIRKNTNPKRTQKEIALEFTDYDSKKAESLLRQVRRYRALIDHLH